MDIISKDKKIIKWLGIPECYQQNVNTDKEQTEKSLLEQIEQEQVKHWICLHLLIELNDIL